MLRSQEKSWVWYLTFPFAHNNYTTIWDTLYYPPGQFPGGSIFAHEEIHSAQQKSWGIFVPVWFYLYLIAFPLGLPILWNPWRKKWEKEAYVFGSGYPEEEAEAILRTYRYGWLL